MCVRFELQCMSLSLGFFTFSVPFIYSDYRDWTHRNNVTPMARYQGGVFISVWFAFYSLECLSERGNNIEPWDEGRRNTVLFTNRIPWLNFHSQCKRANSIKCSPILQTQATAYVDSKPRYTSIITVWRKAGAFAKAYRSFDFKCYFCHFSSHLSSDFSHFLYFLSCLFCCLGNRNTLTVFYCTAETGRARRRGRRE